MTGTADYDDAGRATVDDFGRLLARLDKPVVAWMPAKDHEQPRSVAGVVVKLGETDDRYDPSNRIVVVELEPHDGDRLWRVTGFHSTLNRELKVLGLRVGDRLGCKYEGTKPSTTGRGDFHVYRVAHEPGARPEVETVAVSTPLVPLDEEPF